ncbi:hypothetical protein GNF10_28690 [Nostoc sp. UCD121]|uniref:hypothetical protein n=1 Tax=unclassified Nostoc TaxID=2593658 RepID=UPI0016235171|nr:MULTISPECIES: hypothetical protein [unclassified Nostoc]MBC1220051.1 hypothetical protein [Nostoc sp. UCD120]MBC1279824.1 hypothetical protein [Nostoc sp. UCD121]MBC1293790.1 hypothetical protein [Nostoc sp. UCD122]
MTAKIYTKLGKWYSLVYLLLVALACAAGAMINWIITRSQTASGETFATTFFLAIASVVAVAAIVGIFQEKMWAKWITLGIYSWYIFGSIHSIIQPSLLGSLGIDARGFKVTHLIALLFPVLGIIFLLEKPKTNVSS